MTETKDFLFVASNDKLVSDKGMLAIVRQVDSIVNLVKLLLLLWSQFYDILTN